MSLTFIKDPIVLYPLTVKLGSEDGKTVEQSFGIKYRIMSRTEFREKQAEANQLRDEDESLREWLRKQHDPEKLAEYDNWLISHIAGWDGVVDEEGGAIEYSEDLLRQLMERITLATAIDAGLYEASREELAKN